MPFILLSHLTVVCTVNVNGQTSPGLTDPAVVTGIYLLWLGSAGTRTQHPGAKADDMTCFKQRLKLKVFNLSISVCLFL